MKILYVTFIGRGHGGGLGLFWIGHSFPRREIHLCDFGHSQFWGDMPKNKIHLNFGTTYTQYIQT